MNVTLQPPLRSSPVRVKQIPSRSSAAATLGLALLFMPGLLSGSESADAAGNAAETKESQAVEAPEEDGQDALNKALDSTATQWSFQFAYQAMPDYHEDILDNGQTRPKGSNDYLQARIVAPLPFKGFTILPRLTLRHYENAQGQSGFGNTGDLRAHHSQRFDWGTGRTGIGPLVTVPGNEKVASDEWGYGFAAAVVNSSGHWFYGLLFTQTWRAIDPTALPPGTSDTNPLGIAPFLNFQLGDGWYVGNGDMVALYDWDSKKFYLPTRSALRQGPRHGKRQLEHLRGVPDERRSTTTGSVPRSRTRIAST